MILKDTYFKYWKMIVITCEGPMCPFRFGEYIICNKRIQLNLDQAN